MKSYYEWRYLVEVEVSTNNWRGTNNYETEDEAIADAKEEKRHSRVRKFCTTIFVPDPIKVESENNADSSEATLVNFFCPSDGGVIRAMHNSKPDCPVCRKEMFRGNGIKGDIE